MISDGRAKYLPKEITDADRKKAFHQEEIDEEAWGVISAGRK